MNEMFIEIEINLRHGRLLIGRDIEISLEYCIGVRGPYTDRYNSIVITDGKTITNVEFNSCYFVLMFKGNDEMRVGYYMYYAATESGEITGKRTMRMMYSSIKEKIMIYLGYREDEK